VKKIIIGLTVISTIFLFGCQTTGQSAEGTLKKPNEAVQALVDQYQLQEVDYEYVLAKIGKGTRNTVEANIFDARPNKIYQAGHIPGSYSLPDTEFAKYYPEFQGFDKNKETITYCGGYACVKSPKLAKLLQDQGFTDVKVYLAGMPDWNSKNYSEIDTSVAKSMFSKNSALFIDPRPYKLFLTATIPGSIFMPDTDLDKYIGRAPRDLNTPVIAYCGGYHCGKSHAVARRLIKLGYNKVYVYAAGFPAWKKAGLASTGGSTKTAKTPSSGPAFKTINGIQVVADQEENAGMVYGDWFKNMLKNKPANIILIDVRTEAEFKSGNLKNSINISKEEMSAKDFLAKLPKDKIIIFVCSSGARSLEAYLLAVENGFDPTKVFYLDANMECDKSHNCSIEINEPL